MRSYLKHIIFLLLSSSAMLSFGQKVVIDAGHGWGADQGGGVCANPDTRLSIEMEASHSVSHKLKALFDTECSNVEVLLTRPDNDCDSWVSLIQRTTMSNSWGADAFLSIHTNAGGGTGTETFWCANSPTLDFDDQTFSNTVQTNMVTYGSMNDRRSVEDDIYLSFHLYVLRNSNAVSVLSEMGFGDHSGDFAKLSDDTWRNKFAQSYYESLKSFLNLACVPSGAPLGTCENPIDVKCGNSYSGNTFNGQSNFDAYDCDVSKPEQGKEKVHTFVVGRMSNVSITLTGLTTDLDIHLSTDCTTESCMARDDNTIIYDSLPDGVYYAIVDGFGTTAPAEGDYTLNIDCTPVSEGTGDFFEVYPNPFTDYLRISSLNSKSKEVVYSLFDATGNKLRTDSFVDYKKIYLGDLSAGIYFLQISDGKTEEVKKVVKK